MRPRLLVIDDLFGRSVKGAPNTDRESLCSRFLWKDETGDSSARVSSLKVKRPTADVVFFRGQTPQESVVGDVVENDVQGSLEAVEEGWYGNRRRMPPWSMVLIDLSFSTGIVTEQSNQRSAGSPEGRDGDDQPKEYFGLILLEAIHARFPEIPLLVLSSKPRDSASLEFTRRGALGFIARDDERGPQLLEEALWHHGLLADEDTDVVAESLKMRSVLRDARRASLHQENVLLVGERGVGKELVARYINKMSGRADQKVSPNRLVRPFVTINSAAINPNIAAAELFGIEGKAPSTPEKVGLVEAAQRGDLFLDEIGDMAPRVQASIMRTLETREITRVGGSNSIGIDVRFLAATNTENTELRPDLLDRLRAGGTLKVPPLAERPEDILGLALIFIAEAESFYPNAKERVLTKEAGEKLLAYSWPGNVRELRAVIYDAVGRYPDLEHCMPNHLRFSTVTDDRPIPRNKALPTQTGSRLSLDEYLVLVDNHVFPVEDVGQWAGKLSGIQLAHARMASRLLSAALEATMRRTPEEPTGRVQIHPAAKLVTGNSRLTATKAADLFKRLLSPIEDELTGRPKEALEIAKHLRPKIPPKGM